MTKTVKPTAPKKDDAATTPAPRPLTQAETGAVAGATRSSWVI